jgi:S-adenosylmethionine synthetase
MTTPTLVPSRAAVAAHPSAIAVQHVHTAEWVSPGHPDRLADAIADRVVRHAVALDREALVGVEVALHRRRVFVDGRIAARGIGNADEWLPPLVQKVYAEAGHGAHWAPAPDELAIDHDLCLDDLSRDERTARGVADDQNVVIGWAGRDERTRFLPPAHFLAGELGAAVWRFRCEHAEHFGPDFKLLPQLDELTDGSLRWRRLVLSLQHRADVGYERLHRELLPVLRAVLEAHEQNGLVGAASTFAPHVLHCNGAGSFVLGGPLGDNGLSGKKLVVDHYGPDVPIGGGAIYGKDPHKIDRAGAVRARQWAVDLLQQERTRGVREVRTRLCWSPGDAAPSFVEAQTRDAAGLWRRVAEDQLPPREWFAIERVVAELLDQGVDAFAAPGASGFVPGGVLP